MFDMPLAPVLAFWALFALRFCDLPVLELALLLLFWFEF
jgi:hypothetical protein